MMSRARKDYAAIPPIERLLKFVVPEPNSGCWLWIAAGDEDGYGRIWYLRSWVGAHRVSYILHGGLIPSGMELDHICRVRCCVNPSHLEPTTHKVNCARGTAGQKTRERNKL